MNDTFTEIIFHMAFSQELTAYFFNKQNFLCIHKQIYFN